MKKANIMDFKRILVPVDFSDYSDNAVEYALFLAKNYDGAVTLLHVLTQFHFKSNELHKLKEFEKILQDREYEYKKALNTHGQIAKLRGIKIKSKIIRGVSPANTILEFLGNKFDLVVIGTHGHTGFKKWVYGSVAENVVRLSKTPIVTINNKFKKQIIEKILVPIDFSSYTKRAITRGIEISKKFRARLIFFYVFEHGFHPTFDVSGVNSIFEADPDLEERTIKYMVKFTGIPKNAASYAVEEGKPHKQIKKYVEENNIDLVIMATRGRSELEHFLIGSNAERVIAISCSPVLTVGR